MKKLVTVSALAVLLAACSHHEHHHKGKHHSPELEAAMKSCHESVGKTNDRTKFEECMKAKGFEKPADHPGKKAPKS